MILYHGSTITIDRIDLSKSRPNKDFGVAFYLSANKEQAEGITYQYAFCTPQAIDKLKKI